MTAAIIIGLALVAIAAHLLLRALRHVEEEQARLDRAFTRRMRQAQERSER